ncbi:MAG: T9SS type A sorting domain-containing protein [Candidatus Cloacimonetes bacterium]|nr:T9SS type A sorting domain-containing protein [Candidatus Cloacimonadota bacterium]
MKLRFLFLIIAAMLLSGLEGQKLVLSKGVPPRPPKRHPYTKLLNQTPQRTSDAKDPNFHRLLVILVDFAEETIDDPFTTGNGKFQLEADPAYLYSIAAPPHNRQYFAANLEAMKYYYKAVSAESFQLSYDIYPQDKAAYSLPHSMGYYMDPNASSEQFLARMEEYFKTAFETADQDDPEIDFGSYAHYMIIHAGSDWQHDIMGDTPSDLPSFFIRAGSGKEAIVDEGNTLISHACNVPATISQDFYTDDSGDQVVHFGYGALNAVIAHEFGHSLGFVDLYNVQNYRPAVGVFDIMDSGGSGMLLDYLPNNELVAVEGILPTLPGPFSRELVFGDFYKQKGYTREFNDCDLQTELPLQAISAIPNYTNPVPHTYQINITPNEYLLIENRSVDPDGDGGTAVYTTLESRVVLYPTAADDSQNNPTYEYDYLLPSFQSANGAAIGGGMLIWKVNRDLIYTEGQTWDDGSWTSNYDNNTINTDPSRLGVQVIEADGLNDLGNYYSSYWTGSPYEYFHAHNPILNSDGSFVSWAQTEWRPAFDSGTTPRLEDSHGYASMFGLDAISNPQSTMSFMFSTPGFTNTQKFHLNQPYVIPTDIINTGFNDINIPLISTIHLNLLSLNDNTWEDLMGDYGYGYPRPVLKPQTVDNNADGYMEIVSVHDRTLLFHDYADAQQTQHLINFPAPITTVPLPLGNSVFVTTATNVYQIDNYEVSYCIDLAGAKKLAGWENQVLVLGTYFLSSLNALDLQHSNTITIPETCGIHEPIIYSNTAAAIDLSIYIMADSGNIYRARGDAEPEKIFTNRDSGTPGQFGLGSFSQLSPVLFFGIGTRLYALNADGALLNGFPVDAPYEVSGSDSPLCITMNNQNLLYYPLDILGYLAVGEAGRIMPEYSWGRIANGGYDHLYYHAANQSLYWYYPDGKSHFYIHTLSNLTSNPLVYTGYRNNGSGYFAAPFFDHSLSDTSFNAYVYPNPVKSPSYKLRIENATGLTAMRIYDISGVLLATRQIPASTNNFSDLDLDASGLSSGTYILTLNNNGRQRRIKFAVQK